MKNKLNVTRVRQVSASCKTANLSPWALERQKQYLDHAPERERRALCCSDVPLGGGCRSSLGFDAPFSLGTPKCPYLDA
jgi:hypothetical protein